jgi:hypothetical protein
MIGSGTTAFPYGRTRAICGKNMTSLTTARSAKTNGKALATNSNIWPGPANSLSKTLNASTVIELDQVRLAALMIP